MKLTIEGTDQEIQQKQDGLLKSLIDSLRPIVPEMAARLEKALPHKEPSLKFKVLRQLHQHTKKAYREQLDKMLADIDAVLFTSQVKKSITEMAPVTEMATIPEMVNYVTDALRENASHIVGGSAPYHRGDFYEGLGLQKGQTTERAPIPEMPQFQKYPEETAPEDGSDGTLMLYTGPPSVQKAGAFGGDVEEDKPEPGEAPQDPDFDKESGDPIFDPKTGMSPTETTAAKERGEVDDDDEGEETTEKASINLPMDTINRTTKWLRDYEQEVFDDWMSRPLPNTEGLFQKAGPFIGPRGGKWADAKHTIPWKESKGPKRSPTTEMAPLQVRVHPAISGRKGQTETYRVVSKKDGVVRLSRYEGSDSGPSMPTESVKHFVNDLQGKVDLPLSGREDIDAVIKGSATFLGKGDDGMAFKVGGVVVKVSSTVPFQPDNPGLHRTPQEAADMLKGQVDVGNLLADKGIKGVQRSEFVQHGDKGFQIKEYVDIPVKFTREQLDKIQETVHEIHAAGYAIRDKIQPGIDKAGEPVMFDVGKAAPKQDVEDGSYFSDVGDDLDNLSILYRESGEKFVNTKDSVAEKEWKQAEDMRLDDKPRQPGFVNHMLERAAKHLREEAQATLKGDALEDRIDDINGQLEFYTAGDVEKSGPKVDSIEIMSDEEMMDTFEGMQKVVGQIARGEGTLKLYKSGPQRTPVPHNEPSRSPQRYPVPLVKAETPEAQEPIVDLDGLAKAMITPQAVCDSLTAAYPDVEDLLMELARAGPAEMCKAGPFIGPRGGMWADAKHTIPWKGDKQPSKPDAKKLLEGGLGVKRENMPQVTSHVMPQFFKFLKERGIKVKRGKRKVGKLKATQSNIHPEKITSMINTPKARAKLAYPVIISNDMHLMDGHHRWGAMVTLDKESTIPTVEVDLSMIELLAQAKEFPEVEFKKSLEKSGPFIGPRGGKWADAAHTIPWKEGEPSVKIGQLVKGEYDTPEYAKEMGFSHAWKEIWYSFQGDPKAKPVKTVKLADALPKRTNPATQMHWSALGGYEIEKHLLDGMGEVKAPPGYEIIFRVGKAGESLKGRNAGNMQGVVDFLMWMEDRDYATSYGEDLTAYAVKLPDKFDKYEQLQGGKTKAERAAAGDHGL